LKIDGNAGCRIDAFSPHVIIIIVIIIVKLHRAPSSLPFSLLKEPPFHFNLRSREPSPLHSSLTERPLTTRYSPP
jgi:hypothetical protein